jgi:hypothetical protein
MRKFQLNTLFCNPVPGPKPQITMAFSNITTHQRIVSGFIFLLALIQLIQLPAAHSVDTNPGTIKVKPSSPEPAKPQAPEPAAPVPQTSAPLPRWQRRSQRTNWRAPAPRPKPIPKVYGCDSQGPVTGLPPNLEIGVPVDCVINNASLVRDNIRLHEYLLDVAEGGKVLMKLTLDPSMGSGAYPSLGIKEINRTKEDGGFNSLSATVDGSNNETPQAMSLIRHMLASSGCLSVPGCTGWALR